jgi:hypothetical protein
MDRRAFICTLAAVTCGSGCTTPPDWIERTLVTVDVTGIWYGRANFQVELELHQEGPKVTEFVRARTPQSSGLTESGPINGTVSGDVFTFKQTNGSAQGELSVSGDEMTGVVSAPSISATGTSASSRMVLRRSNSSSQPDTQRPKE